MFKKKNLRTALMGAGEHRSSVWEI